MNKVVSSFTVDPKILEAFNKAKGFNSKSALIEYWMIQYLKNNKEFIPKLTETQVWKLKQ